MIATGPAFTRSELERRMLALCRSARLPEPLVNTVVLGYEVDFLWPYARLIVETDGGAAHHTRRAFEGDRIRDAALLVAGYRTLRITDARLKSAPGAVARQIRALLGHCADR